MIKTEPIRKKIPAEVASVSCVGVLSENYPLSYGNYFSLYIPCERIQVCNFNYENFKESVKRFLTDNQVEVTIFENLKGWKFCAITDERIPEDWYSMWSDDQGYCNGGIHGEEYQEVARTLGKRFGGDENYVYVKPEPQKIELTGNEEIELEPDDWLLR